MHVRNTHVSIVKNQVESSNLFLLSHAAIVADDAPGNLHALRDALADVLQGDQQVVLHRRVLHLLLLGTRAAPGV